MLEISCFREVKTKQGKKTLKVGRGRGDFDPISDQIRLIVTGRQAFLSIGLLCNINYFLTTAQQKKKNENNPKF